MASETELLKEGLGDVSDAPVSSTPVTVDTTAGGTDIVGANASRKYITLQNTGTQPCLIRLGGDPSTGSYHCVLAVDTGTREGNGGTILLENYTGAIKGLTEAGSTVIAIMEQNKES